MTTGQPTSDAIRTAAIDDYYATTDTIADVAKRHGIPRQTLSKWIGRDIDDLAYVGGWENVGGVMRPLFPERRTA